MSTIYSYLTLKKILNIFLSFFEKGTGRVELKSRPYFIKIEPTNKCNLRCHGCLHSAERSELLNGNRGDMSFELFKKIIDELKDTLIKVSLYALGEPLIYKHIGEMVRYLSEHNIGSVISSNLNYLPRELFGDLIKYRLTHLIVSLDGSNQENYHKFRQGGNFDKVIGNIRLLQEEKKKQKSIYPIIEVQTIKFGYITEQEIDNIKQICKELGVERFSLKKDTLTNWTNQHPAKKQCYWLYGNIMVQWNGTVQPCCHYYEYKNNNFGNMEEESFMRIWNNDKYKAVRNFFNTGTEENTDLKCYTCVFFKPKKLTSINLH